MRRISLAAARYVGRRTVHRRLTLQLLGSSHIGSKKEALSMFKLAVEKGVKPGIELVDMKDCSKAVERVSKGDSTYRRVLPHVLTGSPLPLRPQAGPCLNRRNPIVA